MKICLREGLSEVLYSSLKGVHAQIFSIVILQNNYIEDGKSECLKSISVEYNCIMPRVRENYLCEETTTVIEIASCVLFKRYLLYKNLTLRRL